jgi:hypothetical protein
MNGPWCFGSDETIETIEFYKLCAQMIQKANIEKEQPSLNDEAAQSLSIKLVGTLGQEIPKKKLQDKWKNMKQEYGYYYKFRSLSKHAAELANKMLRKISKVFSSISMIKSN